MAEADRRIAAANATVEQANKTIAAAQAAKDKAAAAERAAADAQKNMGGMSTFSSFVCGSVVLMHASIKSAVVASVSVVVSLVLGYLAILVEERLGGPARRPINTAGGGAQ